MKKSKQEIKKLKEEVEIKKEALGKYKEFIKKKPAFKCHLCQNKFFQTEDFLQ